MRWLWVGVTGLCLRWDFGVVRLVLRMGVFFMRT
jgi:hypothetical protein